MANREHKPYPKSERDRSTRPEDAAARLQVESHRRVPGDVGPLCALPNVSDNSIPWMVVSHDDR